MGTQLASKTVGIIGLGRIGLAVAKRLQAMEMKVWATILSFPRNTPKTWGSRPAPRFRKCSLDRLPHVHLR